MMTESRRSQPGLGPRMEMLAVMLAAVLSLAGVGAQNAPVVTTEEGKISGIMKRTVNGNILYAYQNIPFAKPPVNNLRFKDPVPAEPWQGVRNGTIMPQPCLQVTFDTALNGIVLPPEELLGSEDCLYLNVFRPLKKAPAEGFPVMVWIHGGGFFAGGAREYLPFVLLDKDITLVVIQYRLGIMGMLCFTSLTVGNYYLVSLVQETLYLTSHALEPFYLTSLDREVFSLTPLALGPFFLIPLALEPFCLTYFT
ncbi:esterase SG1-like [Panulirus ornatus]|uniref:esterase SG1-like n=1 Tax=Panulirus ornatus TaxID=150431 RepID=UPI003A8B9DA8